VTVTQGAQFFSIKCSIGGDAVDSPISVLDKTSALVRQVRLSPSATIWRAGPNLH